MATLMKTREKRLSITDSTCPICLCILIEPVTLPCQHELCMPCFNESLDKVNLLCPLCRLRISSWARKAKKQNRLINEKRWKEIQRFFPERVKNRLKGLDDSVNVEEDRSIIISDPGEIKKEYLEEKRKLEEEKYKIENANETSFWKYISSETTAKENNILSGIKSMVDGNKKVSNSRKEKSLESNELSESKSNETIFNDTISDPEVSRASNSSNCANISYRSVSANSNDSISQELCHFKPIKAAPKTPPKPQPDGRVVDPPIVLTTPRNLKNLAISIASTSSPSSIENCTSLRRKLNEISADRLMMNRKRERIINQTSSATCSSISPVPLKVQRRKNDQFGEASTSKSNLSVEQDMTLTDQTSICKPNTSTASSFVGLFRMKPSYLDDESSELNVTRVSSTKLVISMNRPSANKRKTSTEIRSEKNGKSTTGKDLASMATQISADDAVAHIVEQQMAIMEKLKQEKEDLLMAQKLQQNYDMEWRNCKGLREPYHLRKRHVPTLAVATTAGNRRKHV